VRARPLLGDAVDADVDALVVERDEARDAGDGGRGVVVGPGEVVVPARVRTDQYRLVTPLYGQAVEVGESSRRVMSTAIGSR
jgi:hypothetical protein